MLAIILKATQMALDAIQILGGNGYINDYPTGRFLRDAKLYEIGAGTSEVRRLVIGRAINGEYKWELDNIVLKESCYDLYYYHYYY